MANAKGLLISGIILGIVGIILFIISFVLFPTFLREATNKAIKDAVIVDSRKSSRFNDWAGQQSIDNLYLQYYYAWNLTNPDEFLNGQKPIFKQNGPFNYKYEWKYSNITFIDNGNLVKYVNQKSYIFQDDDYSYDPDLIQITNINPAFLGLMSQLENNAQKIGASSEELLFILGSGPQMNQFIQDLSTDNFTQIAFFFNGPVTFNQRYQLIIESLSNSSSINGTTPQDYFLQQWANSTTIPTNDEYLWTDMLVSYELDEPLGVSLESAKIILDPNNTLSILNLSNGIFLWLNSTINSNVQQSLANQLNISLTQLLLIRSWYIEQFNPQFTSSLLLEKCNIPTLDYLGLCQFINTIPLNYQSVSTFNDYLSPNWISSSLPTPFEITSLTESNVSFTVMNASKYLFSGDYSLLTIQGIGEFASHFNSDQNFTIWNLNLNDATILFSYIFGNLPQSYSENFIKSFYSTSGLIVTKSLNDWLWNCNDELLEVLDIENNCALQLNNTVFKPSIIYTGKNDTSKTNSYYQYQEQTIISVWNQGETPVYVNGFAETGQFPPLGGIPETLTIFEENVLRPLQLNLQGPSQVEGINTQRYYLQNNSFPVSQVFNNSINGFVNLTGIQGLPLYVSLWDMYEVPPQYSSDLIQGLNQSFEVAQIPLDLEPITGNALYYNLKLQINLAIPNNSNYFQPDGKYSSINIPSDTGIFLPSIKIGQTATPSDDNINLLKSQFKEIQNIKIAPVVVFSIFGGMLVVAGIIMSTIGVRRMFIRRGYHQIS